MKGHLIILFFAICTISVICPNPDSAEKNLPIKIKKNSKKRKKNKFIDLSFNNINSPQIISQNEENTQDEKKIILKKQTFSNSFKDGLYNNDIIQIIKIKEIQGNRN